AGLGDRELAHAAGDAGEIRGLRVRDLRVAGELVAERLAGGVDPRGVAAAPRFAVLVRGDDIDVKHAGCEDGTVPFEPVGGLAPAGSETDGREMEAGLGMGGIAADASFAGEEHER